MIWEAQLLPIATHSCWSPPQMAAGLTCRYECEPPDSASPEPLHACRMSLFVAPAFDGSLDVVAVL